jgi:hypothetical protein
MKPEHVLIFYASPNPVPGAAGRLRQTVGLSIIFYFLFVYGINGPMY